MRKRRHEESADQEQGQQGPREKKSRVSANSLPQSLKLLSEVSDAQNGEFIFNSQFLEDLPNLHIGLLEALLQRAFRREDTARKLIFDGVSPRAALAIVQAVPTNTRDSLLITNASFKTFSLIKQFISKFSSIGIGKLAQKSVHELTQLLPEYVKNVYFCEQTDTATAQMIAPVLSPGLQELGFTKTNAAIISTLMPLLPECKQSLRLENIDSKAAEALSPVIAKCNQINLFSITAEAMQVLAPLCVKFFNGTVIAIGGLSVPAMTILSKCLSDSKFAKKKLAIYPSEDKSISVLAQTIPSCQFSGINLADLNFQQIKQILPALQDLNIGLGLDGSLSADVIKYVLDNLRKLDIRELALIHFTDFQFKIICEKMDVLIRDSIHFSNKKEFPLQWQRNLSISNWTQLPHIKRIFDFFPSELGEKEIKEYINARKHPSLYLNHLGSIQTKIIMNIFSKLPESQELGLRHLDAEAMDTVAQHIQSFRGNSLVCCNIDVEAMENFTSVLANFSSKGKLLSFRLMKPPALALAARMISFFQGDYLGIWQIDSAAAFEVADLLSSYSGQNLRVNCYDWKLIKVIFAIAPYTSIKTIRFFDLVEMKSDIEREFASYPRDYEINVTSNNQELPRPAPLPISEFLEERGYVQYKGLSAEQVAENLEPLARADGLHCVMSQMVVAATKILAKNLAKFRGWMLTLDALDAEAIVPILTAIMANKIKLLILTHLSEASLEKIAKTALPSTLLILGNFSVTWRDIFTKKRLADSPSQSEIEPAQRPDSMELVRTRSSIAALPSQNVFVTGAKNKSNSSAEWMFSDFPTRK